MGTFSPCKGNKNTGCAIPHCSSSGEGGHITRHTVTGGGYNLVCVSGCQFDDFVSVI